MFLGLQNIKLGRGVQRVLGGLARPVRGPHLQPVHPDILLQRQGQDLLAAGPEPAAQLSAVQIM